MLRPEQLTHWGPAPAPNDLTAELQRLDAGTLTLRSSCLGFGNLGGPGCLDEISPTIPLPNGSNSVDVAVYRWQGNPDPIYDGADVTAGRVLVTDAPANRWELLSDEKGSGFMVDHGIASVFDIGDAATAHHLATNEGIDILQPLYEYRETPWFMWHKGVLAFRCGRGDGRYDIWVGRDTHDHIVEVVLDLELLPSPHEPVGASD